MMSDNFSLLIEKPDTNDFQFIIEEDTQAVFLMSESYKEFLSSYLYEVHEIEMEWIEFDTDGRKLYCEDKPNNTFKAYTVSTQ